MLKVLMIPILTTLTPTVRNKSWITVAEKDTSINTIFLIIFISPGEDEDFEFSDYGDVKLTISSSPSVSSMQPLSEKCGGRRNLVTVVSSTIAQLTFSP